jgi:predicted nucleotide-binding protein
MSHPSVVAVVDDEEASALMLCNTLMSTGPDMKRASTTMRPLRDYFTFVPVVVDPYPSDDLPERALAAVRRDALNAAIVMVDLSFDRLNRDGAVESGRSLALALQGALPGAAVGVYTKHGLDPIQYAQFGSDGFSFFFPDVLKMTQGPKRLLGDDWHNVLSKLIGGRELPSGEVQAAAVASRSRSPIRIFVGSSTERKDIALMLTHQLNSELEAVSWTMQPSIAPHDFITGFLRNVDNFNCGVFVFAPDDDLRLRGEQYVAVRDNVVLELGVFLGRYGRERSFIVEPDDATAMRHLTDLHGYTTIRYRRATWDGGQREVAMAKVATELITILTRS